MECHFALLARLKRQTYITFEFLDRTRRAGKLIADIQLNNLIANHRTGVCNLERDFHTLPLCNRLLIQSQITISKTGETQTISERIQWRHLLRDIIHVPVGAHSGWLAAIEDRHLPDMAWEGDRQFST